MGSWFLDKKQQDSHQTQPMTALRMQSSVQGKPIPKLWGRNRVSGNLIWYGDFVATAVNDGGAGGGKGGGGANSGDGSVSYTYQCSVAIGLAGEITDVRTTWVNKAIATANGLGSTTSPPFGDKVTGAPGYFSLGFEVFTGGQAQQPWGYLVSAHPTQALAYRGLAYLAQANINLGSSAELPNYSFEITGKIANVTATIPDANPRDVVVDFFTNEFDGVPGWPEGRLGSLDQYATYALATGLLVSPVLTDATEGSAFLTDLFRVTNSSPRWSNGKLDIIPLGDTVVTGNGVTFTPNTTPLYDLTNDDFMEIGDGKYVRSVRRSPSERYNAFRLEYLNRASSYDPDVVTDKDEASIDLYGERPSEVFRAHFVCLNTAARLAVHLMLGREQIPNIYTFRLPARFVLIDVEDLVTLTRPEAAMFRQAVRITEISEESDGSFTYQAEEYLGTVGAPAYGTEAVGGFAPNTNADPGSINAPLIFEPTEQLAGGLEVWCAVSGQDDSMWGGCNVYVSYDDVTYQYIDMVKGPARTGVLTAALAAFASNPVGPTIDTVNTLSVDLSTSDGVLQSGTQGDALALNTACYVGGEIIAYATAVLTGPNAYNLTYLVRDAYGTESQNVLHPIGTKFARLDSQILEVPYDQTRIGATIYLKFQSFNLWGGGQQDVSSLPAYTYKLTGLALTSPLAPVTNVRTVFEAGFTKIWWDEVEDFRSGIRYIIRKGDTFAGGQDLGTLAHPPFVAFGAGDYWIMPTCQPLPDLIVYGETPASISIQGNMLTANIVQTTDFQAVGWPGTYQSVGKEGTDPNALLRLIGAGDILTDPNVLINPDVLNAGDIATSGIYTVDPAYGLNAGYVADLYVNITWQSSGIPVGTNILTDNDILNNPDILSAGTGAFVEVWIEVRFATTTTTDMFAPTDMFGSTDMFASPAWGEWQRYVPGVYRAQYLQYRAVFSTIDTTVIAYLQSLVIQVSIPARTDHYIGNTVGTGGLTIVFMPDDAIAYKPFNGGPLVGGTFNHPLPAASFQWPSHPDVNVVIDAISLSQMTFHFENATGTHVAVTNVDTYVQGY